MKLDFLGIGAPRCGTTWLVDCLRQHSQIFIPNFNKELHYFDGKNEQLGLDWYHSFFKNTEGAAIRGEFSPSYMHTEGTAQRIYQYNPDIKLIVCLRHPVERALSHYQYTNIKYNRNLTIEEYIHSDKFDFLKPGLFCRALEEYLSVFEKKNIKIIFFEDLKLTTETVLSDLYQFLNVSNEITDTSKKVNPSYVAKSTALNALFRETSRFIKKHPFLNNLLYNFGVTALGQKVGQLNKAALSAKKLEISLETRNYLNAYYEEDLRKLAVLLYPQKVNL